MKQHDAAGIVALDPVVHDVVAHETGERQDSKPGSQSDVGLASR